MSLRARYVYGPRATTRLHGTLARRESDRADFNFRVWTTSRPSGGHLKDARCSDGSEAFHEPAGTVGTAPPNPTVRPPDRIDWRDPNPEKRRTVGWHGVYGFHWNLRERLVGMRVPLTATERPRRPCMGAMVAGQTFTRVPRESSGETLTMFVFAERSGRILHGRKQKADPSAASQVLAFPC